MTFEHATGYKRDRNLGNYLSRSLRGTLRRRLPRGEDDPQPQDRLHRLVPIPEVIRDINAIQLALDKYDPQAELKVMGVSTWFDPGKGGRRGQRADRPGRRRGVPAPDSPAPIQAAERRGVYAVGYASDMQHFGPKTVSPRSSTTGARTIRSAQAVMDGTWKSEDSGVAWPRVRWSCR